MLKFCSMPRHPSAPHRYVRDLLARKRQLNELRTQELNRQHKAAKVLQSPHTRLVKICIKEIAQINTLLEKAVASITEWASQSRLKRVTSCPQGSSYCFGSSAIRPMDEAWPATKAAAEKLGTDCIAEITENIKSINASTAQSAAL